MNGTVKLRSHEISVRGIGRYTLIPGQVVEVPLEVLQRYDTPLFNAAVEKGADGGIEILASEAPEAEEPAPVSEAAEAPPEAPKAEPKRRGRPPKAE